MGSYYAPGANVFVDRVFRLPAHEELEVPKHLIPHPVELGFELSVGEPTGQVADYRAELADGRGLHIRDRITRWTIHWDHVFPSFNRWVDHLREDSPVWFALLVLGVIASLVAIALLFVSAILRRVDG